MNAVGKPEQEPFFLDKAAARRLFDRSAASFHQGDALHREIAARMLERFEVIRLEPRRILDLGCGALAAAPGLASRFPGVPLIGMDLAHARLRAGLPTTRGWRRWLPAARGRLQAVCGEMAALPFTGGSFDLAWSNLALHWLDDPSSAIREVHRTLATGGLFMFSTLGPDTLRELRAAFMEAGGGCHVRRFIDLHDIGDALAGAGFAAPVMDMEMVTLTYPSLDALFADLRATGSTNALLGRSRALTGRAKFARTRSAYERVRRDGRLPASFEVIYGHAWKAAPRVRSGGESVVTFAPRRK